MLVSIDESDPRPIYVQIVQQVKEQVLVGELRDGDELPSVRELGEALGISLHTARSAYQALSDSGLVRIRLGKRARIAFPEPIGLAEVGGEDLSEEAHDLVVDSLLRGLSRTEIHDLVDGEIDRITARRAEATEGSRS